MVSNLHLAAAENRIVWPVMVKYYSDDLLVLVSTQSEWGKENLYSDHLQIELAMDSSGRLLTVSKSSISISNEGNSRKLVPIAQFESLVRAYAAYEGHCCVSKLSINEYAKGFEMISAITSASST